MSKRASRPRRPMDGRPVIGQKMIQTAGPERMRHLEQVLANDFKIKPVADEHRRKRVAEAAKTPD